MTWGCDELCLLQERWLETDADRARPITGTSSACHAADPKVHLIGDSRHSYFMKLSSALTRGIRGLNNCLASVSPRLERLELDLVDCTRQKGIAAAPAPASPLSILDHKMQCMHEGGCDVQVKRFLPFLAGSRSCIGMELAKLNYTTAVASLLSRFSFRLSEDVSTLCMPPVHRKHAS